MQELEYPFDADRIISKRRKIKKSFMQQNGNFTEKKIAVLGGSTTAAIVQSLELFLLNQGTKASFYESEYGMYYEDAVFPNEKLEEFNPDIVYIHTTNRNILNYPTLESSREDSDALLKNETEKFKTIWERITHKYSCPVIQNNFEMPLYRLLGNKDASDFRGRTNFLSRLNSEFYKYAQEHKDFFICDINYLSADYGLREWSDPFYWHMYKYALNVNAVPYLAFNVANIIKSIYGKNKKGLVLDLDNTLWGGVIGDEGAENIEIGQETSAGQAYSEFQNYLKELKQLGVLLNINSKNDYDNALSGLKHPESVLSPEDFIEIKANWEPKDKNFAEIASALSLMPESLVFVDDNPAERNIVSEQIRGVSAPDIGEAHEYILNIDRNGYFEQTYMSEDDLKRNDMYKDNAKREQLKSHYSDYGEYLNSLEMKAEIKPFEPLYISRIAQLTNKTNQFNLTTKRYTPEEIEKLAGDKNNITLYGRLEDKFGDNGIVSVIAGRKEDGICHIDLWLMSCRVLKRDMEYAMADALVNKCLEEEITEIRGYYYPTAKNSMVKDFYPDLGFDLIFESDEGSVWSLRIDESYKNKNERIKTEE